MRLIVGVEQKRTPLSCAPGLCRSVRMRFRGHPIRRYWFSAWLCDCKAVRGLTKPRLWPFGRWGKLASLFFRWGSSFRAAGLLLRVAKYERPQKPSDNNLHAGRRPRHDRPGDEWRLANEPLAGDSGRHKMTGGLLACWMLCPGRWSAWPGGNGRAVKNTHLKRPFCFMGRSRTYLFIGPKSWSRDRQLRALCAVMGLPLAEISFAAQCCREHRFASASLWFA